MSAEKYLLVGPGGGERLRFLDNSTLVLKTTAAQAADAPAFYEYIAEPAAKGSPQHVHHGHDETFYVVDGHFEFTLGTATVAAEPGAFLSVSRGQPHAFRNVGEPKGRIVGTFTPPRFAQYFRELAQIIEEPAFNNGSKAYVREPLRTCQTRGAAR